MKIKNGFTLIELLIVVGVLALLLGLLGPAILKSLQAAVRAKQDAEAKVLAGAIIEYWHDNKKWPIGDKDPYKDGPKVNGVFTGSMFFSGQVWDPSGAFPNSIVFNELYKAKFNDVEGAKTYFDINNHITTSTKHNNNPVFDGKVAEARLKDVLTANTKHKEKSPIFCYWARVFKCPNCDQYYSMDSSVCTRNRDSNGNNKCSYYTANGFAYTFKPRDKSNNAKRALFPYVVEIDFYNETAIVSRSY